MCWDIAGTASGICDAGKFSSSIRYVRPGKIHCCAANGTSVPAGSSFTRLAAGKNVKQARVVRDWAT